MVFENITLFELHLDNPRFSAIRGGDAAEEAAAEEETSEEYASEESAGSGGSFGRALGVLAFLVVAGLVVRRLRSGDDGEAVGVEETEGISIEQAAE